MARSLHGAHPMVALGFSARSRLIRASVASRWITRGTWGRGVLLCGLAAAGEAGRAAWALRLAGRRDPPFAASPVNLGPLHLAALEMPGPHSDPCAVEAALAFARALAGRGARRHASGALSHLPHVDAIWADTAWMAAPLLARAAVLTGSRDLADQAVLQVIAHMDALRDSATGLLSHSRFPLAPSLDDRALWARGNGWVLDAAARVIEAIGPGPAAPLVLPAARLARALARHQRPDGLWPAILDDPDGPGESSSAALAARAILSLARSGAGVGDLVPCARRATRAVIACIDRRGLVRRSQGPVVWASIVPVAGSWPWTQGLVLLLLAEIRRGPGCPGCVAPATRVAARTRAA